MKKVLILAFILFSSIFFLGPQPNTRNDVNYSIVKNHARNLSEKNINDTQKYITRALRNNNYNYFIDGDDNIFSRAKESNILFVTSYSLDSGTNSNYNVLASVISAMQIANKTKNSQSFDLMFTKKNDITIDYIKTNYDNFHNLKYVFIFDNKGYDGEYHIISSSTINGEIVNLYKQLVANPTGYSLTTKTMSSDVQFLELGILNTNAKKNQTSNEIQSDIINSIHQLFLYEDNELANNSIMYYLMYLDIFIVLPSIFVYLFAGLTMVVAIISLILNFKKIQKFEILKAILTILIAIFITVIVALIPFDKIFNDHNLAVFSLGNLTNNITLSNPIGLSVVSCVTILNLILVYIILIKVLKITIVNILIAINLLLVTSFMFLSIVLSSVILVILMLILSTSLVTIFRYNLQLKTAIVPGLMLAVLIPLLTSNIYLLYTGFDKYNLLVYAILLMLYTIVTFPLLAMYFKNNQKKAN